MQTKTLTDYNIEKKFKTLIKSHKELVIQANFRNNQNYVLSDYWKFEFYNKYFNKRTIVKKYFSFFTIIFWLLFIFTIILKENNILWYNFESYLSWILIWTIFFLVIWSILYLIYYFIKWKILYYSDNDFVSNVYIFRKRIRNNLRDFNKYDFISFKK